jgi:hypothetical protein
MSDEQKNPEQKQDTDQIADLPEKQITAEDAEAVKGGGKQVYFVVNMKDVQISTPPSL